MGLLPSKFIMARASLEFAIDKHSHMLHIQHRWLWFLQRVAMAAA